MRNFPSHGPNTLRIAAEPLCGIGRNTVLFVDVVYCAVDPRRTLFAFAYVNNAAWIKVCCHQVVGVCHYLG